MKYNERLEGGYINRLQGRGEVSESEAGRRRYELERWVTGQRRRIREEKRIKKSQ